MTIEELFIQEYGELKDENKKLRDDNRGLEDWARDAENAFKELVGALQIVVKCKDKNITGENCFLSYICKEDGLDQFMAVLRKCGLIETEAKNPEPEETPELAQEELAK